MKKLLAFILCTALVASTAGMSVAAVGQSESNSDRIVRSDFITLPKTDTVDINSALASLPDNDELFSDYVHHAFYDGVTADTASLNSISADGFIPAMGQIACDNFLNDKEKEVYEQLKTGIEAIADGSTTSTKIAVNVSFSDELQNLANTIIKEDYDLEDLALELINQNIDYKKIVRALLADCPYSLYWFDKTKGFALGVSDYNLGPKEYLEDRIMECTLTLSGLIFSFPVSKCYSSTNEINTTETSKSLSKVATAVNNAAAVVEAHKSESDYQKIVSYKNYILDSVEYYEGNIGNDAIYGDPWQLIWAFDEDPETNIVCEGYSKAFQYLCDLSDFKSESVQCYSTDGQMLSVDSNKNIVTSNHMWNIVTMDDGKNYLADLTNSDTGTVGQSGGLFLAGTKEGSADTGYIFATKSGKAVGYVCKSGGIGSIFTGSSLLILSSSDYVPDVNCIGASLSLKDNIGVNFLMMLSDEILADEMAYMEVTVSDRAAEKIPVSSVKSNPKVNEDGSTYYMFSIDVSAKQMSDEIKVKIISSKGHEREYSTSVREYSETILNDAQYAVAYPLVKAMLNYGSASQLYFGYNTDNLANQGITEGIPTQVPDMSGYYTSPSGVIPEGLEYYGSSLVLKSQTKIRHYFSVKEGYEISDYEFQNCSEPIQKENSKYFYVEVSNITPHGLDESKNVTVSTIGSDEIPVAGSEIIDNSINASFTIPYSAMSYANRVLALSDDDELKKLIIALYHYNQKANEYVKL